VKFGIREYNNVANINISSYSTIEKMPTGATLANKLVNCLKNYRLFIGDVKISGCVCTFICGSYVVTFPIFPHFKKRWLFVERSTVVLYSRGLLLVLVLLSSSL